MSGAEKNTLQQNSGDEKRNTLNNADGVANSFKQAEKDINNEPDPIQNSDPATDPDDGELARFEGED